MSVKKIGKNGLNKSGQITLFVIIALLIVGIVLLLVFPKIKLAFVEKTPNMFVPRDCFKEAVQGVMEEVLINGAELKPELYFRYENETIAYVCYTSEWYKTCMMQNPLLKQSIEAEINANIQQKALKCLSDMESQLKREGYEVKSTGTKKTSIAIVPKKIIISPDINMVIQKGEEQSSVISDSIFKTELNSNVYDILMIASSIQNYEARYGDASIDIYMSFYPSLKVEKKRQEDGTKIYIITERNTEEKFQFATRSLAWPPGIEVKATGGNQ